MLDLTLVKQRKYLYKIIDKLQTLNASFKKSLVSKFVSVVIIIIVIRPRWGKHIRIPETNKMNDK